jgi:hypothetical protein
MRLGVLPNFPAFHRTHGHNSVSDYVRQNENISARTGSSQFFSYKLLVDFEHPRLYLLVLVFFYWITLRSAELAV